MKNFSIFFNQQNSPDRATDCITMGSYGFSSIMMYQFDQMIFFLPSSDVALY